MEEHAVSERLARRSGAVHVGFVLLMAFVAYTGSEPSIFGAVLEGRTLLFVWLVVMGSAMLLLPRSSSGALVGLAALALGGGGLVAVVDQMALAGFATTYALSVLLAESLAFALLLARRPTLSAPLSLALAASSTGALAYLLDGGLPASSPLGIGLGGVLAIAFVLHARYAEGALALRHAPHEVAQAALTRWLEGVRQMALACYGFFSADEDLRRGSST